MRVLSGWCSGNPQQPASAVHPRTPRAYDSQRVDLEEKELVFSGDFLIYSRNQYAACQIGIKIVLYGSPRFAALEILFSSSIEKTYGKR